MISDPGAAAALAVCESILIALAEKGLLTEHEIHDLLSDAGTAHCFAAKEQDDASLAEMHREAADIIRRIRENDDSILGWTKRPPSQY
jgi:hypothetical protein